MVRVRDWRKASMVAAGVRRFNGVRVSRQRILARPHFTIEAGSHVAGWIGFEGRGSGVYELVHLSVKPRFRHGGLAQSAVYRVLNMVRSAGGRYAYTRINHRNFPSMCLALTPRRAGLHGVLHVLLRPLFCQQSITLFNCLDNGDMLVPSRTLSLRRIKADVAQATK